MQGTAEAVTEALQNLGRGAAPREASEDGLGEPERTVIPTGLFTEKNPAPHPKAGRQ